MNLVVWVIYNDNSEVERVFQTKKQLTTFIAGLCLEIITAIIINNE